MIAFERTGEAALTAQESAVETLLAPSPTPPTPTSLPDGTTCFVNRRAGFSLTLSPGWITDPDWDRLYNTMIYNYYQELYGAEGGLPLDKLKIDLSVITLSGKSFDQWVRDERLQENTGDPVITLSAPYSFTLGLYAGLAYTATGYGDGALLIKLAAGDSVISIGMFPLQSTVLDEALDMLATLDVSGSEECKLR